MTTYRLFPATSGPGSSTSYSGTVVMGVAFEVTSECALNGIYWWVADSAQAVATPTAALWEYTGGSWSYMASSEVSFGTLTAGQWNYVALATPIVLTPGTQYVAAVGFSNNFPATFYEFGATEPYAAGITNGPLTAYSDTGGSNPAPSGQGQMAYNFAGDDPTVNFPNTVYSSSNYWIDVEVSDIYVVQTQDGNTGGPTFDAEVAEHNTVVLIPIMYGGSDVTSSNVTLGGSTVTGTTLLQHVTDESDCSHDIWILPDCPAGQTEVGFELDGGLDSVFIYEIAGLGPSPTVDQIVSAASLGPSAIIGAGPTSPTVYENEIAIAASAAYNGGVDTEPDIWISPPRSDSDHGWSGYQVFSSSGATPSFAFVSNELWTAGIVTLAPAPSGVSASGAISLKKMVLSGTSAEKAVVTGSVKLKKMVLSGASAEKTVATGAISLKKMVLSGAVLDGITFTTIFNGATDGDFSEDSATGDTLLIFVALYNVDGPSSSNPKCEDTSIDGTVQLWEVQNPDGGGAMYSSAWMLPNLPFPGSGFSIDTSGGSYPSPDGAFVVVKVTGLGPSPTVDRVITNESTAGDDGSIGPTSAIRSVKELVVAHCAIYGGWPDDGPGSPWTSSAAAYGSGGHGIVSYQVTDSSGGTYTWAESGNGNAWAGGIATIAATSDSNSASVAVSLKKMVLSGASAEKAVVTGAVKLKKMVLSGASAEKSVVTGAVKLKKMVLSGASAEKSVATGAVKLKKMVLSGASAEKSVATGALKLKKMVLSGASIEKAVVTGAINLKKMKVAGSGIVWTAPYVAYAFDEGSGSSIIDYSGNSRNLTISGSNSWVTGQGSYAKAFQSGLTASDGAAWVNGSYLPALTGDVTVQAWYKYTDTDVPTGTTRMHIGGLYSTSGTARLSLWGYRSLSGVASAPNATVRDSASAIIGAGANGSVAEDNNWHNAACVYHASGLIEVYLDGTKVSSATPTSLPIGNNVLDIAVGSSYSGTPFDQCPVQDMRVFAGALNAAEVVHWMNTPVHPTADLITATITLKKMVLSGASIEKAVITGAIKLKKMVLSGASAEKSVVTNGIKLKKMVLAATVAKKPAITGTISLKKIVLSGASHEKAVITGSIHLNKMRVHGEEARRKASNLFVFAPP